MANRDTLLAQVLSASADAHVPFDGRRGLLRRLGFDERIRDRHHIFTKAGVEEILNLQPEGRTAKAYQVKVGSCMRDDDKAEHPLPAGALGRLAPLKLGR